MTLEEKRNLVICMGFGVDEVNTMSEDELSELAQYHQSELEVEEDFEEWDGF